MTAFEATVRLAQRPVPISQFTEEPPQLRYTALVKPIASKSSWTASSSFNKRRDGQIKGQSFRS